ncbi:MAG: CRISPR-associated protein Cse1, partial [Pseudomonadota bacterium]
MSLLVDPLIKLEANGVERRVCLPELFVALLGDRVDGYPALRRHQGPSWHMFLVQLSAIAMHRAGLAEPPTDAETWRKILRAVTQEKFPDDEPWRLVVDDPAKPAFMQPPVPNGVELQKHYATPDAIDMVITAK